MTGKTDALLDVVRETLDAFKAQDIEVVSIAEPLLAEVFVVATGTSKRHLDALAEKVQETLKKKRFKIKWTQPSGESGWCVLDLGNVIVHLFLKEVRERYKIEELWKTAPRAPEESLPS